MTAAALEEQGFRPGVVSVVQTFGARANFHPHVHAPVPHDPMILYNVACLFSQAGDVDSAIDTLAEAVETGLRSGRYRIPLCGTPARRADSSSLRTALRAPSNSDRAFASGSDPEVS